MISQLIHEFQPIEIGFNNKTNQHNEAWYVFSIEPICVIDADGTKKVQISSVRSNNTALNGSYKYGSPLGNMHNTNSNTLVTIEKSYAIPGNNNKLQLQFSLSNTSADVGVYVKYNSTGSSMHTPCFFDVYATVFSNTSARTITNDVYLYSVKFLNQRPRENINDSLSPSKTGNPVFSDEAKTGFLRWSETRKSISTTVANNLDNSLAYYNYSNPIYYPKVATENYVESGKWYMEILGMDAVHGGCFGICSESYNDFTEQTRPIGHDTAGQSISISNQALRYKGANAASVLDTIVIASGKPDNSNIYLAGHTHLTSGSGMSVAKTTAIAVMIDADERTIEFRNIAYPARFVKMRIPWEGKIYICKSQGIKTTVDHQAPVVINLGYYPFMGNIPAGYKAGFGKEISVDLSEYMVTNVARVDTGSEKVFTAIEPNSVNVNNEHKPYITESLPIEHMPHGKAGWGYIKSKVTKGPMNTPTGTIVQLIDTEYNLVTSTVWSDGTTGEFEFKYVPENRWYTLIALDPDRQWVTASLGEVRVQRLPGAEGRTTVDIG